VFLLFAGFTVLSCNPILNTLEKEKFSTIDNMRSIEGKWDFLGVYRDRLPLYDTIQSVVKDDYANNAVEEEYIIRSKKGFYKHKYLNDSLLNIRKINLKRIATFEFKEKNRGIIKSSWKFNDSSSKEDITDFEIYKDDNKLYLKITDDGTKGVLLVPHFTSNVLILKLNESDVSVFKR